MLLISIKTLQDDRFLRPLQNIGGLFFEDSTIGFEQEEANLIVDIHIEENVKASARLTDVATGNVYEETFAKDLSAFTDEKRAYEASEARCFLCISFCSSAVNWY